MEDLHIGMVTRSMGLRHQEPTNPSSGPGNDGCMVPSPHANASTSAPPPMMNLPAESQVGGENYRRGGEEYRLGGDHPVSPTHAAHPARDEALEERHVDDAAIERGAEGGERNVGNRPPSPASHALQNERPEDFAERRMDIGYRRHAEEVYLTTSSAPIFSSTPPVYTAPQHVPRRDYPGSLQLTASSRARLQLLEFEAQEKLVEIELRKLQLQEDLVKKRLAAERMRIQVEDSDGEKIPNVPLSDPTAKASMRQNIDDWLRRDEQRRENYELGKKVALAPHEHVEVVHEQPPVLRTPRAPPTVNPLPEPKRNLRYEEKMEETPSYTHRDRVDNRPDDFVKEQRRTRSPTPTGRNQSAGRGIEQLAATLDRMANERPPPRQALELPIYKGDPGEWLLFKAAMTDSTELYHIRAPENMQRLRNCLQGEAKKAVMHLLYNQSNPDRVMEALQRKFGHTDCVVGRVMADLKKLPHMGSSAMEINDYAVALENIVCVLETYDQQGHLQNPELIKELTEKFDPHMQSKWCDYAYEQRRQARPGVRVPELVMLTKFLNQEADRAMTFRHATEPKKRTTTTEQRDSAKYPNTRRKGRESVYTASEEQKIRCPCCNDEHFLPKCAKFQKMSVSARWDIVKGAKLCFNCLQARHRKYNCKKERCGEQGCRYSHHRLLHSMRATTSSSSGDPVTAEQEAVMSVASENVADQREVLLKVCPVVITGPGGDVKTYALLDEGSTVTLIEGELARAVKADGPTKPLRIHGVNTTSGEKDSRQVQIKVQGANIKSSFELKARTVKDLTLHCQTVSKDILRYPHMKGLSVEEVCYKGARPRLLIGADNWHLIVSRELRTGKRNEPAAARTELGWVICGTVPRLLKDSKDDTVHHVAEERHFHDEKLENLMKEYFDIDSLGVSVKEKKRPLHERAVEIFERTARRVNGRYEVGLPWKEDEICMPPNYDGALKRLKSIEKKMDRDSTFRNEYTMQVENLLQKGYAEECDGTERDSKVQWFLPHFAVRNPNKPGKIRLVFDAAATYKGTSLNDQLLEGPDLLRSLPGILFRFREKPIAVTADIQEMFLQVKIRKEDQPAQMFLWRGEERRLPPQRYKMTSMIFGASSSPFLAHSVRNRNARDFADSHPEAFRAITESHYMDDYVDSYSNEEEAIRSTKDVDFVHGQTGFKLRSWNSNSRRLLEGIPEELRAREPTQLVTQPDRVERTLGLLWDARVDELGFNTSMHRVPEEVRTLQRAPTKREALSAVMSIYDPLGLLSHYTISAKIMLQNLWRIKLGWDEPLPTKDAELFAAWLQRLEDVAKLRLPRCYDSTDRAQRKELHVFCDASEEAYATAAYWTIYRDNGAVDVVLAAAKAKVAPIKSQSIPRLELQAALIGARLAETIRREHRWEADETTFWTDSQTVLHWIRNDARRYTPFVAHRLGEIAELTEPQQWRWVPTDLNVADDATRLTTSPGLKKDDRWFVGPQFLCDDKDNWPQENKGAVKTDEEEYVNHLADEKTWLPDISRFSSFERLIKATARVLYFIDKCRKKCDRLEVHHLERAEHLWLRQAQRESFADEIERIRKGKIVARSSRLFRLDPVLEDDLLCVRGRINAAKVPSCRKPVILDRRHPYTKLLVENEHRKVGHANNERVVNDLRQRYWVIHLRPTVRAVAKNCALCKIRRATPSVPAAGDLPLARIDAFQRPFTNCGVDYFGPMTVTIGRRHEKRWGALFTCLTTRAVHMELVASLSTDSAIMALRRMAARRGWPRLMWSDNGTNFRGADAELRAAYNEWLPELRDYGLQNRMEWRFIPPGAPHMGGAWERLVRSIKTALLATLHQKAPKEEVLGTLLVEAEHSVNARPLTHVSVDPNDAEALTPNHFILGSSSGMPTTGACDEADRRHWRAAQALADHFWRRWVKEYLPTLVPRGQPNSGLRPLKPGDLVIVVDPSLPRNVWPRGIVERVYPGPDGQVRNLDVRTQGGVFRRPVSRIAVLPVEAATSLRRGENVTDSDPMA